MWFSARLYELRALAEVSSTQAKHKGLNFSKVMFEFEDKPDGTSEANGMAVATDEHFCVMMPITLYTRFIGVLPKFWFALDLRSVVKALRGAIKKADAKIEVIVDPEDWNCTFKSTESSIQVVSEWNSSVAPLIYKEVLPEQESYETQSGGTCCLAKRDIQMLSKLSKIVPELHYFINRSANRNHPVSLLSFADDNIRLKMMFLQSFMSEPQQQKYKQFFKYVHIE